MQDKKIQEIDNFTPANPKEETHTHTHTHTQRQRQRDRDTHRDTHGERLKVPRPTSNNRINDYSS